MLAEDDPAVRAAVTSYLEQFGFEVDAHDNGVSAQRAFAAKAPDVLVVDRMLPGVSGDELSRMVRSAGPTPILMLTALGELEDRVEGLELGVDDYLTKPFSLRELALRVRALQRRSVASHATLGVLSIGRFRVDPSHRRIWVDGREIALTSREYEFLLYLLHHPNETMSRDHLLREVWGWQIGEASTITVHVRRLREKIETDPAFPLYLRTEWGAGYRFVPGGETA